MLPGAAYEQQTLPASEAIRSWFPSLQQDFVFLENAGGSQLPGCVADAIRNYMLESYVQIGAGYPASQRATQVVDEAHAFMDDWFNANGIGKVALGPSATAMINIVANAYGDTVQPGDEFILCDTNHEANAGAWERLEKRGATIKYWRVDPDCFECSLDELDSLITPRTRIVAFPHVSNLLGEVVDVKAITKLVHDRGAKVFVDGVAYAPHGLIDVADWGVDWYVFSNYKVYGPHMASLFGTFEAMTEVTGPNHFFIPKEEIPRKWELGAVNHEGCAGILGLKPYLAFLAGGEMPDRLMIDRACRTMTALEKPLIARLLDYLENKPGVRIYGPGSKRNAVGTFSFSSDRATPAAIAAHLNANGIGMRAGHMYAVRLCKACGIDLDIGLVRISLLHYNTMEEIDRCIAALEDVL